MKSLFKNSIYYIAYRLINVIYPLITATYVSRVLKPAGVGEAALAQNVVIFLVAVSLLGIPNYGVREISKTSGTELNRLFTELFIINLISTCIISAGFYYIISLSLFHLNRTLYRIYGIILLLNIINVDWFYQGKEEFKYTTIRSGIVKLISIIAIFICVKDESDLCTYGLIFALAYAGNYTFNALNLRKFVKFEFKHINLKRHLKSVFALAITAISNEIYVTLDTLMLGVMSTSTEIGYYSNSMKLMRILINVVTALGTVILPRLSQLEQNENFEEFNKIINRVVNILLWITIPCTMGILILPECIETVLFGEAFSSAASILAILSLLIIPRAFSNMSLQVLVCTKNDAKTSKVYFTGMLINAVLNFIFIQYAGAKGAAIASVISEIYICVVLLYYSKKIFIYTKNKMFFIRLFISVSTMATLVFLCKCFFMRFQMPEFILLMICMLIGVASYCGISILLKNEVPMLLIDKLKGKFDKRG